MATYAARITALSPATPPAKEDVDWAKIAAKAKKRAVRGGIAGFAAGTIQVTTLMWMRTTVNYQYRNGGTMFGALRTIYAQGGGGINGVLRFYAGYPVAMVGKPIIQFGDVAANEGTKAVVDAKFPGTPAVAKGIIASIVATGWRICVEPIGVTKNFMQVNGTTKGLALLGAKIRGGGPQVLWAGALGSASASFVGNVPYWSTFNALDEALPEYDVYYKQWGRNACVGAGAAIVSDTCSNSIRVVKTYMQTSPEPIGYVRAAKEVIEKDGIIGLFGRGLGTKLASNTVQAALFGVLMKGFVDKLKAMDKA